MANATDNACDFLESLQRFDLSMLLRHCRVSVEQFETALDWFSDLEDEAIIVRAPAPIAEALRSLSQQDRKRIAEAILSVLQASRQHEDIRVETLDGPNATGAAALLSELLIHRAMMIDVATGGARIQDVDDYYRAREVRIRQAIPEGVTYDNPHADSWAWYRHWSAELPQYKDRRFYVRQLFGPAIEAVAKRSSLPSEPREATGWERVDRALSKARTQLETASAEEDCQAIGLLCRDPTIHDR